MTKNDYVKMLQKHVHIGAVGASNVIDFYIEAGMLKVKEDESEHERNQDIAERVFEAWKEYGIGKFGCNSLIIFLDKAGLKIVEK